MARSSVNPEASRSIIDPINFTEGHLIFDKKTYEIVSFKIEDSLPQELYSSKTIKLNFTLNRDIFHDSSIEDTGGLGAVIKVFLRLLEGEPWFELEHGYVIECTGNNIVLLLDLKEETEIVKRIKGIHNTKLIGFKDLIDLDKQRQETIRKLEKAKPYLKRFRISLEED